MYQFFVEDYQISNQEIRIIGEDVNHIKNVLRLKETKEVRISNKTGKDFLCKIKEFQQDCVILDIVLDNIHTTELQEKIYLFVGLVKGEKMEWIIQKAVELGVFEIIPVEMKYSVVKLDDKKSVTKTKRWQMISESAAKQSKRSIIPRIKEPMSFKSAITYANECGIKIVPYEAAHGMLDTKKVMKSVQIGMDVCIFIGPEGGFSDDEIHLAKQGNCSIVSLGSRILRAETAAITAVSMFMLHFELLHAGNEE